MTPAAQVRSGLRLPVAHVVVVIGRGLIGLATARHVRRASCAVTTLDPARGSAVAAGFVNGSERAGCRHPSWTVSPSVSRSSVAFAVRTCSDRYKLRAREHARQHGTQIVQADEVVIGAGAWSQAVAVRLRIARRWRRARDAASP